MKLDLSKYALYFMYVIFFALELMQCWMSQQWLGFILFLVLIVSSIAYEKLYCKKSKL